MIEDGLSFFCGGKIIYLQNNLEVQSKGEFVQNKREKYQKLVQKRIMPKREKGIWEFLVDLYFSHKCF